MMKLVVSDAETGKAYKVELNEVMEAAIIGKVIGEAAAGDVFGLSGYEIKITGGSDKDGFPMKPTLKGAARQKMLMRRGIGYKPLKKGMMRRKMVRGNTVSKDIVQVNCVVVKKGEKNLEELLGSVKKEGEKK